MRVVKNGESSHHNKKQCSTKAWSKGCWWVPAHSGIFPLFNIQVFHNHLATVVQRVDSAILGITQQLSVLFICWRAQYVLWTTESWRLSIISCPGWAVFNNCRKTNTKVVIPINNNGSKQCDEPIKIHSNYL